MWPIPPMAMRSLPRRIMSYNVARDAWLLYRGAIGTNVPTGTYFEELIRNLSGLKDAIHAFQEAQ